MERKIIITNILILRATIKSKQILMSIRISHHHIPNKTIQEVVIFNLCNNHNLMMIILVIQIKILVKALRLKQRHLNTIHILDNNLKNNQNNHLEYLNSNNILMIENKEVSRKWIDRTEWTSYSMILQIYDLVECVGVNLTLIALANMKQTVSKFSKKRENNLMLKNRELLIINRKS